MMNTIYYYYYLFYTRILPDDEPHSTVIFSLSVTEGFIINGLANIISIIFFCYNIPMWIMIGVTGVVLSVNYKIYYRSKKMENIVIEKPKLLNSNAVSIIISLAFFLFGLLMIVTAPFYARYLLDRFCS